jgi:HlyD family secretion protein
MNSRIILALFLLALLLGCGGNNSGAIEASGTIEGTDVHVASQVMGQVREVRVAEGSQVATGDTIVLVDATEYLLQLNQARATMRMQESAYRLAVEGSRREDIIQAEAAARTAATDYKRMEELLATQTVTQKQYDDAYARYVAADQTYQKVLAGSRAEEIAAARARTEAAEAQVELLEKKLRDCRITSPTSGTVTLRSVEPGEFVTVGREVVRVTFLERVKLTIYVNVTDLGDVHLGQQADVRIDSAPDRSFDGEVVYISPVAEFTPKNVQTKEERTKLVFAVRLEVKNPDGTLKPGLPADATLQR